MKAQTRCLQEQRITLAWISLTCAAFKENDGLVESSLCLLHTIIWNLTFDELDCKNVSKYTSFEKHLNVFSLPCLFFFFFCFILSHFVSTVFEKSYRHFLHGCWAVSMAMGVSSLASEIYPWRRRRRRRGRRWWKVFWLQMNLVVFLWFHIFCVLLFSSMVLLKHTSIRGFVFVYWVHVPSTGLLI